jgi:hypothetical protein
MSGPPPVRPAQGSPTDAARRPQPPKGPPTARGPSEPIRGEAPAPTEGAPPPSWQMHRLRWAALAAAGALLGAALLRGLGTPPAEPPGRAPPRPPPAERAAPSASRAGSNGAAPSDTTRSTDEPKTTTDTGIRDASPAEDRRAPPRAARADRPDRARLGAPARPPAARARGLPGPLPVGAGPTARPLPALPPAAPEPAGP